MEQYITPEVKLVPFIPSEQITYQVYNDSGNFGGSTEITSMIEPSEGFEDW